MRKIVFLILTLLGQFVNAQCTGVESYTISPISNSYPGGSNVQICYTMQGWNMLSSNWVEGFQISTSQGLQNLTPVNAPNDCDNDQNGDGWIWVSQNGIGTGWFYETDQGGVGFDGDPSNDWGDFGDCNWTFCFNVTVIDTCVEIPLYVSVTTGGDGTWGSWTVDECPLVPFNIPIGVNDPIEFESIFSSPLIDTVCLGGSTTHSLVNNVLSTYTPSNPVIQNWNSVGVDQISIIEETVDGCKDTTYFTVHVLDLPEVDVQGVDPLCSQHNPINLTSTPENGSWSPFGPNFNPQFGTTWIKYSFEDDFGCINSDSTLVRVNPNPNELEIFGIDTFVNCLNSNRSNFYNVRHNPNSTYHWFLNGDETVSSSAIYFDFPNISNQMNYISVYEVSQYGCIGPEAFMEVYSEFCSDIYVPNSFSPNGDNVNDRFKVIANSPIDNFEMGVYDRWGQLIYKFKSQNDEWIADNFPNDVYVYKLGGRLSGRMINKSGHIVLIR